MAGQMLRAPQEIVDAYGIPDAVVREAYASPLDRQTVFGGLAPVRTLCAEIGVVTPALVPYWRMLGIWDDGVCRLQAASL